MTDAFIILHLRVIASTVGILVFQMNCAEKQVRRIIESTSSDALSRCCLVKKPEAEQENTE